MPSKYWIKLYHEILHDPKMARLPDRLWRRAIELFLMAGETGDGGELPDIADMAWTLRVDQMELADDLAKLAKIGVLTESPDGWVVTKFAVRQAATSDAKRMAQWRERNRKAQYEGDESVTELVTNRNAEPDTDTDTDIDTEVEAEEESERDTTTATTGGVFRAWENSVGLLQQTQRDMITAWIDEYGAENARDAILEAAQTVPRFGPRYVEAILKRWANEGRNHARASPTIERAEDGSIVLPSGGLDGRR